MGFRLSITFFSAQFGPSEESKQHSILVIILLITPFQFRFTIIPLRIHPIGVLALDKEALL